MKNLVIVFSIVFGIMTQEDMDRYKVELVNGEELVFQFVNKPEVDLLMENQQWSLREDLSRDAECLINSDNGQVLQFAFVGGHALLFQSEADFKKADRKIITMKEEQSDTLRPFMVLTKEELSILLKKEGNKKLSELSEENDIDVFLMKDGRLLVADVYGRDGELHASLDDYVYTQKTFFGNDFYGVVIGVKNKY